MKNSYEKYMKRCIKLAKMSYGRVSPNPLVGAVVLDKNGNFAGEGRHECYGQAHAEVNAIAAAEKNGIDVAGGTIVVNLEPCSHFGKTPPCADLIIQKKLKKVVIGCVDLNPKVSGNGIKKLENAGIEVVQGILEQECRDLNEIFIKNQTQKMPFVAIKTATTLDGKIATKTGSSKWITSTKARKKVQELRNQYDAILTGSKTVIADNPSLTCRLDEANSRNPVRIVIDSNAKTSPDSKVYANDGTRVVLCVCEDADVSKFGENVEILRCPTIKKTGKLDLDYLFKKLYETGVCSILVEAGGQLNGAVLQKNLADKLYQFVAPKILGDKDAKSFAEGFDINDINDSLKLKITSVKKYTPDVLVEAYIHTI